MHRFLRHLKITMQEEVRAYTSPAKKATVNRTFTVYGGRAIQLPVLDMSNLKIAASQEARDFVRDQLHDPATIGFPDMGLFKGHGVILQPLNATTSHVLLVVDDEMALVMMAMLNHTYQVMGYELIYDTTTTLLESQAVDNDSGATNGSMEQSTDASSELSTGTPSTRATADVLGMEVA